MNLKSQIPVYYDDVKGWIVLSDESIPRHQLFAIRDYVYKVNSQRAKGMTGEKRARVENALKILLEKGLSVVSTKSHKTGLTMFESTAKQSTKSIFDMRRN